MAVENELPQILVTPDPQEVEQGLTLSSPDTDAGIGPINLSSPDQQSAVPPSAPLAEKKTDQIIYGLGDIVGKEKKDIYTQVSQGNEEGIRQEVADKLNEDLARKRHQLYIDYLKSKKSPLTMDELEKVTTAGNVLYKDFDPTDVVEKAYASKYISTLDTANSFMSKAYTELPRATAKLKDDASELTTKIMYTRNLKDNLENEITNQSWLGWGADQFKNLWQPYQELKLRGQVPEVGSVSGGLLLGTNLEEQANYLWSLPTDQFKDRLSGVVNNIKKDNPTLAAQFVDYVLGVSTSDKFLNNAFTLLAPGDLTAIGHLGVAAARKASVYNRASKAMKDVVKSTEQLDKGIPDAAVVAEGAGDNVSAATIRATQHVEDVMNNNVVPVKDIKETLTTNFRLDGEAFDRNPGKLYSTSRELYTQFKDGFVQTGERFWGAINKAVRVDRTPVSAAIKEAAEEYMEKTIRKQLPDLNNTILDIVGPARDFTTNTRWFDVVFGNIDKKLFSNPDTALNYAKARGYSAAQVVERVGDVEIAPARIAGGARDLERLRQLPKTLEDLPKTIKKTQAKLRNKALSANEKQEIKNELASMRQLQKQYKEELLAIKKRVSEVPATIQQNGTGYALVIRVPYNETSDIVRNWHTRDPKALSSAADTTFTGWRNAAIGWFRGANDTLSYNETLQRLKATYAQSILQKWAKEEAMKISDIARGLLRRDPVTGESIPWWLSKPRQFLGKFTGGNRQMFDEFNRTLDFARTAKDPVTGDIGYFFKTPGELEDHYQRWFQRMPTVPEYEAYFAHVKLTEADRVFREIFEFRNRARVGTEQHQVFFKNEKGERVGSGYFDAIRQSVFPGGRDQILVMGQRKGEEKLGRLGGLDFSPQTIAKWREDVEQGKAKIFRIYDPDSHPLASFSDVAGNERVRYVLAYDTDTKPLEFNHVPRRGGGHFEYDYEHYLKQARVIPQSGKAAGSDRRRTFEHVYIGDATIMPIDNRIMGADVAKHLNIIRQLIKDGDLEKAQAYAEKKLFIEWDEIHGWFKPSRGPDGKVMSPMLNLDEPIMVVPRNKKIYDLDRSLESRYGGRVEDGGTFIDGTKSGSDAQQFQVSYTMQRDSQGLKTVENVGSQYNPIYKWVPAKMVDPIPTMNRALNRAIQSVFMDDYKIYAVEHWLAEAMPLLKDPESAIRSAPFYYFNNIDRAAFKPNPENWARVTNLLANRDKINQFIGIPNKFDTLVHGAAQHLADVFYTKFGPEDQRNPITKTVTLAPLHMLNRIKDPIQFVRSVTFNAKLGMFNPVQFLVQAQTHATIIAISPRHGTVGTFGGMLGQWTRINKDPAILNHLDDLYTKMNMFGSAPKPGEFMEATKWADKYGVFNVGGEYVMRDDQQTYKFFKNDFGNFLDAGQMFFREGERSPRMAAWYTAFREFRHKHPTGALSTADLDSILARADDLTVNMTRASASNLHTGVLSLSTQFLSFQLRQMELFWGKRLAESTLERNLARARLVIFYSGLYGIPSAIGVSGMPFTDMIKEYAANNGYVVGDKWLSSLAMEGVPAMLYAMTTGGGDISRGDHLNFGSRFGQQGLTQLNEMTKSDTSMWKIIGGASGGVVMNTWTSLNPFWRAARSMLAKDEHDNQFKLTASDMLQPFFGEISTYNAIKRQIIAMNLGRWINRNEQYIEDITGLQALVRNLTGLTSVESETIYNQANISKEEEALQKQAKKEIFKYYQRGVIALQQGDNNTAQQMFKNVRAIIIQSDLNPERAEEIMAQASRGYETQIDSANWSFGNNAPASLSDTRLERLRKQLIIQNKQKAQ